MELYKYQNYKEYVYAQTRANIKKLKYVWIHESTILEIKNIKSDASNILCHGTRNATEQKFFQKEYTNATVIGTEISHTANKFPMTVQHDFHDVKQEWIKKFDIVYSNAFDHSHDPVLALSTWSNQLADNGILCIEAMTGKDNKSSKVDPLEIYEDEIIQMCANVNMNLIHKKIVQNSRNNESCSVLYIFKK